MMPLLLQEDNQCLHLLCRDTVCVTLWKKHFLFDFHAKFWCLSLIFQLAEDVPLSVSTVAAQAVLTLCHLHRSGYPQRRGEHTDRTVQFVFTEKKCRNVCSFRGTRRGRLSVTFPSSMGLSLMCTTGPGCVLVDLCKLEGHKKTECVLLPDWHDAKPDK